MPFSVGAVAGATFGGTAFEFQVKRGRSDLMSPETLQSTELGQVVSVDDPQLNLRLRPDLITVEQSTQSDKRWVVKDPLSLEYFHFGEQEWFVLACLRQPTTIKKIQEQFRAHFPPLQIQVEELKLFLTRVVRDNLVIVDGKFGLGERLFEQAKQKQHN